jgi:hypothetical protein
MILRIGRKDRKIIREMKRADVLHSIILMAMYVQCKADWFDVYGQRALQHFGMITQPRVLTADNAWRTRRNWNHHSDQEDTFYVHNYLTDERRPITEQQYDNENTITSDGQLNI